MKRRAAALGLAAVVLSAPALPASAAPTRSESITIIFAGTPGTAGMVIARGAVFDIGTLTPGESDTDALVFSDGVLFIQETGSTVVQPPRPPSCIVRFTTTGTYHVAGGTGRFADARGTGTTIDSGLELLGRSGAGCGETGLFVYDKVDIRGSLTTS